MKPIQFSQYKQWPNWIECRAEANVTAVMKRLDEIHKSHPLVSTPIHPVSINWKSTRKLIATLLVDYYEILFNPDNRYVFREPQLKNLTLLFPIDDSISISLATNFILLPLPIPTYEERFWKGHYASNCPFLKFDNNLLTQTNELIRDMDYSIDSNIAEVSVSKPSIQWNREKRKQYQHTDSKLKLRRTNQTLSRTESRLWSYKFQDIPKRIAERLPKIYNEYTNTDWYSIRDMNNIAMSKTDSKIAERFNKEYYWYNAKTIKNNQYIYNKLTLLEIPPQIWKRAPSPHNEKLFYKLEDYSRTYLKDTMFTWNEFARYFDFSFTSTSKEAVIQYFINNALPMNEYHPIQIKSGITKLKNMIKDYNRKAKNIKHNNAWINTIPEQLTDSPYYQTWRWRPNRDYLNTHGAKYYKTDWTVIEFETYNEREIYKKSKEQLTHLYSNQQSIWTTQQSSQQ